MYVPHRDGNSLNISDRKAASYFEDPISKYRRFLIGIPLRIGEISKIIRISEIVNGLLKGVMSVGFLCQWENLQMLKKIFAFLKIL